MTNRRSSDRIREKVTIIHHLQGVSSVKAFKKNTKVMDFLRNNRIIMTRHEWKEDEWDLKFIGFFTNIYPATMISEYATKVVSNMLENPVQNQSIPDFRIKPIPVRIKNKGEVVGTSAFGLEVKSGDVKEMTALIKENSSPGTFMPFQMKQINGEAYNKAVEYVASRNTNIWTIVVQYMSEGAFF